MTNVDDESAWTLAAELAKLAGSDALDMRETLVTLGIVDVSEEEFEIVAEGPWERSGAETYSYYFTVQVRGRTSRYLLKACVAYAPGQTLSALFGEWLSRRQLLTSAGVSAPRLLAAGSVELVEEYVPSTVVEAIGGHGRAEVIEQLGWTCGVLARLGFVPLDLRDWRSRGTDVVLIDFGQDLGPPNMDPDGEGGIMSDLLRQMEDWRVKLSPTEVRVLGSAYEGGLHSG